MIVAFDGRRNADIAWKITCADVIGPSPERNTLLSSKTSCQGVLNSAATYSSGGAKNGWSVQFGTTISLIQGSQLAVIHHSGHAVSLARRV